MHAVQWRRVEGGGGRSDPKIARQLNLSRMRLREAGTHTAKWGGVEGGGAEDRPPAKPLLGG